MGVVTSGQIAVKPLRVTTSATLDDIAAAAARMSYPQRPDRPSTGWGSIADSEDAIGLPASVGVIPAHAVVETGFTRGPQRRLRLRYYWVAVDPTARRTTPLGGWSALHYLNAADVFFYEEREGSYTALVSVRTPGPFRQVITGINELLYSIDDSPMVTTDTIPEALNEDFFLWLIDMDENSGDLGNGLSLVCINEISSKDRLYRSARFKDTANAERIELAALIGMGHVGFGPAKVLITSEVHGASFDVELHLDGGFQPLRSSSYDDVPHSPATLGVALVDDIWTSVLPDLRTRYNADDAWDGQRRLELRDSAIDAICDQLGLIRRPAE